MTASVSNSQSKGEAVGEPSTSPSTPRVVSLIASATEILHAVGGGEGQVARSHECDWPPAVLNLPALTKAKFKVHGATSAEIDQSVKGLLEQGLAVYEVDADGLKACASDVILTQDQCEVCAVSLSDVQNALCTWTESSPQLISLRPHTLADVYSDIVKVAVAIGREKHGLDLVQLMKHRIDRVTEAVTGPRVPPRLAFIEWIDPPMSGGHWIPELTRAAGGISIFGTPGENSPWVSWEEIGAADPDVIVVAPCGYEIPTSLAEMPTLQSHPLWCGLRAVVEGNVFVADGNAYFNRPGPRLVETTEILAEILHPERCDFGHHGTGYVRWTQSTGTDIAYDTHTT